MRIAGVNIPDNKKSTWPWATSTALARPLAAKVLVGAKIDLQKRAKDLAPDEVNRIQSMIEKNYKIEGELRQ